MKKEWLNTAGQVSAVPQYLQQKTHCEPNKGSKALFQVRQVDRKKLLRRR